MTGATDSPSMSMTLGELKGQMREIVHQLNNMSSKMDAISHEISKNSGIPEEVEKLKLRVAALEEKESKREGAMGLGVRSEEHTSELQSLMRISYAVFCLKKKKT